MPVSGTSSCTRGAVALEPLSAAAAGQNFRAIAYGDCTGNWQPPAAAALAVSRARPVRVVSVRSARRDELRVAIAASAAQALELELRYDPARLRFARVRTLGAARTLLVRAAEIEPGVVRIAAAGVRRSRGIRLLASFAPRVAGASVADVTVGAAKVDETMVRATISGRH